MITLSAPNATVPSLATATLRNSANAPNSRNQLKPLGSPKRSTRPSSRHDHTVGAAPSRGQRRNSMNRYASPSQLAIDDASAAPATPIAGAPAWPSINSQLRPMLATIVSRPARICILVLPKPPNQLPSASVPTIAATDDRRI
jgi:hypothetical protein